MRENDKLTKPGKEYHSYGRRSFLAASGLSVLSCMSVGIGQGKRSKTGQLSKHVSVGLAKMAAQKRLLTVAGSGEFWNWKDGNLATPKTYYMRLNGKSGREYVKSAYVFPVRKNGADIGYITAAARREMNPILEYSTATPPNQHLSKVRAAVERKGDKAIKRPIYHGGTAYGVELSDGDAMNLWNKRKTAIAPTIPSANNFNRDEVNQQWELIESISEKDLKKQVSANDCGSCYHIGGVPIWTTSDDGGANNTHIGDGPDEWGDWDGCTPIAASMIIGFYEYVHEFEAYKDKNAIIDRLHIDMETNSDGETAPICIDLDGVNDFPLPSCIADGIEAYNYGGRAYEATQTWGTDKEFVLEEIANHHRPYLLNMLNGGEAEGESDTYGAYGNHSVTVVGYESNDSWVDTLIIHDTWNNRTHRLSYGNWGEKTCTRVVQG